MAQARSKKKRGRKKGRTAGKVTVNFQGVEGNLLIPEDDYLFEVEKVTEEVGEDSGEKYLAWKCNILEGEYEGKSQYINTSLQPQALWKLRNLLEAMGIEIDEEEEMDLVLKDYEGLQFIGTVAHETYKGGKRSSIVAFSPTEEEEGPEEEEEDPEEEDPEEEDGEDEEGPDEEETEFSVGDKVKFKDGKKTLSGKIVEIDEEAELATVRVKKEDWEVELSELFT